VDTLNAALASLDDNACATLSSPDSCPEGHECAEAVETLAAYYSNCNIAHDDEDDAFQALEEANGPCMAHAEHAAHDNPEVAVVAAASKSKPWGEAMGAAALVNVVTLAGVALCVPVVAKSIEAFPKYYEVVGTSFAGGALLSTAVFLLLYESNHLIPITEKQTEGMAAAIWGSMVLLGALPLHVQPPPYSTTWHVPCARAHAAPPPSSCTALDLSLSLSHTHTHLSLCHHPTAQRQHTLHLHLRPRCTPYDTGVSLSLGLGYAHMRGDDRATGARMRIDG